MTNQHFSLEAQRLIILSADSLYPHPDILHFQTLFVFSMEPLAAFRPLLRPPLSRQASHVCQVVLPSPRAAHPTQQPAQTRPVPRLKSPRTTAYAAPGHVLCGLLLRSAVLLHLTVDYAAVLLSTLLAEPRGGKARVRRLEESSRSRRNGRRVYSFLTGTAAGAADTRWSLLLLLPQWTVVMQP